MNGRRFRALAAASLLAAAVCRLGADEASELLPAAQAPRPPAGAAFSSAMLDDRQGVAGPELCSPGFEYRPELDPYLKYFKSAEGLDWLRDGMDHAEPFRDFILSYLSAKELPPELYFVAMIESSFRIDARSRSGAAGLWQFMRNSMGDWMRHDEWMDQRYDFWASTKGGLEKLQENFGSFGDWPLALAAYNAGDGRVSRLLKKNGGDYWDLRQSKALPRETREYVPQILAAAYVGSHPGRYGLPVRWDEAVVWDKVEVKTAIPLKKLALAADVPPELLELGNAELRFDITPPGTGSHYIKVPRQYTDAVVAALNGSEVKLDYALHRIAAGDTLYAITKKYRTTNQLVLEYNPGLSPRRLRIGQKLIIPLLPARVSAEKGTKDRS